MTTRQRRTVSFDPSSSSTSELQSYKKHDKPGKPGDDGEVDKGLGFFLPVFALGMLRFMSATSNIIHDCDEVFNYWEPLHYLIYKSGFQTWEYSSQFALRSYLYVLFHKLVGWPASCWFGEEKVIWPPKCCQCHVVLEEGTDSETTRLGCLHVIHTNCLDSHIKGFPQHTAPAGYVCPACSTSIWPPKIVKDSGSCLHSKLKEAILQTGMEKNLFGNHPVSLPEIDSRSPPPAFASDPLMPVSGNGGREYSESMASSVAKDSDGYPVTTGSTKLSSTDIEKPGATTWKGALQVERQNSEISYYADDEVANRKKYTRRGTLRDKFFRSLLPFWSSALPTLPVTAPPRKDASHTDDTPEGRTRHHRSSRMDPRKILLVIAIMACMATMGILYYRIAQRGFGEEVPEDEQQ